MPFFRPDGDKVGNQLQDAGFMLVKVLGARPNRLLVLKGHLGECELWRETTTATRTVLSFEGGLFCYERSVRENEEL